MSQQVKQPKIRSVKFNVLMNMILTSSSLLFPLITVPYVSRVLSTSGTGYVAFAQSVSSYFCLVALLGMTYYGVRACAKVRDDPKALSATVKELLIILLCSSTIVTIVYIVCLLTVPQMQDQFFLFCLFGLTIWLSSFGVEWFYQALEQYEYITVRNVCFKILALVLMFAFVHAQSDYVVYGLIVVLAGYGSNVLNMLRLRKLVDFSIKQPLHISRHFKPMFWFMVAAVSSGMYTQIDVVLLGFLGTNTMVGLYQLVSKIKSVLVTAVNSVGGVMLPRLSYYKSKNKQDAADDLIAKNLNFVMLVGAAIIALLLLLADPIVLILGGKDFADSAPALRIVGPAVMFSAINIVLANHMISGGNERAWATVNAVGLVFAILANACLIPMFGIQGAAISIVLCEGLILVLRTVACRDFISRIRALIDPGRIFGGTIIAGLITFGMLMLIPSLGVVSRLLLGTVVFGGCDLVVMLALRERFTCSLVRQITGKIKAVKQ